MPSISATAPGKIILFGEHAVVYGRPAIAVPVEQVRAKATILARPTAPRPGVFIEAPDIGLAAHLDELPVDHAFTLLFAGLQNHFSIDHFPACHLRVTSTIPIASGLGSGAAISVAILRAAAEFLGHPLPLEDLSRLAYEAEKAYHGTPSGIDNTVIAYAKPVYFIRQQPLQFIRVAAPFNLVIAQSGITSSTADVVAAVRQAHDQQPDAFETLFDQVARISNQALHAIQQGTVADLGPLMTENHRVLQHMGVSLPELDHLIDTALQAGALGAKLSGAGRGGNILALVNPEKAQTVAAALQASGAASTILTCISPTGGPPC